MTKTKKSAHILYNDKLPHLILSTTPSPLGSFVIVYHCRKTHIIRSPCSSLGLVLIYQMAEIRTEKWS